MSNLAEQRREFTELPCPDGVGFMRQDQNFYDQPFCAKLNCIMPELTRDTHLSSDQIHEVVACAAAYFSKAFSDEIIYKCLSSDQHNDAINEMLATLDKDKAAQATGIGLSYMSKAVPRDTMKVVIEHAIMCFQDSPLWFRYIRDLTVGKGSGDSPAYNRATGNAGKPKAVYGRGFGPKTYEGWLPEEFARITSGLKAHAIARMLDARSVAPHDYAHSGRPYSQESKQTVGHRMQEHLSGRK